MRRLVRGVDDRGARLIVRREVTGELKRERRDGPTTVADRVDFSKTLAVAL